jgi:hypothetical protein
MAAIAGKSSNYITQALDVCLQGLQHWEAGNTPVGDSSQHQRCASIVRASVLGTLFFTTFGVHLGLQPWR